VFRTPMTLDRMHRILTVLVGAICLFAIVTTLSVRRLVGIETFALLVIVLGLAWAMSPRELVIDDREVRIVRRAWWPLRVPLDVVSGAAPLDRFGGGAIRLFGVGGFFGSYGLFTSSGLGRFRLYSTRRGQALILRRSDDALPIVLTPDDVAGAIGAIDKRRTVDRL
jgi:Bacterial PH domain